MSTHIGNAGSAWTFVDGGVVGTNATFPLDTVGSPILGATSSYLHNSKMVQILGYEIITPQVAATFQFVNNAGSPISGLTFPADVATRVFWGDSGIRHTRFITAGIPNSNLGAKLSDAGVVAIFYWRKLA